MVPEPKKSGNIWVSNARIELHENNQPLLGARLVIVELAGNSAQVSMDPQTGTGNIRLTFSQPVGFTVTATRQDDPSVRATVYVYVAEETPEERRLRTLETREKIAQVGQKIREAGATGTKGAKKVQAAKNKETIEQSNFQAAKARHDAGHLGGTEEENRSKVAEWLQKEAVALAAIKGLEEAKRKKLIGLFVDVNPKGPASEYYVTLTTAGEDERGIPWSVTITDPDHPAPENPGDDDMRQRAVITNDNGVHCFRVTTRKPRVIHARAAGTAKDEEIRLEGPRPVSPTIDPLSEEDLQGSWWEVAKRAWRHQTEKQRQQRGETP
jgi:hypothetical protein